MSGSTELTEATYTMSCKLYRVSSPGLLLPVEFVFLSLQGKNMKCAQHACPSTFLSTETPKGSGQET